MEYGQTPAYTGTTPTKTATAQYTYTFNNTWSPAIVAVTEAATYTAQFGSTVNKYTITWKNDDNSLIDETTVEYGVVPTHDNPSKENTEVYTYAFLGWEHESDFYAVGEALPAVTGLATYKATYEPVLLSIEVGDGKPEKTINATVTVNTTIVHKDGNLTVEYGKTLTTHDLILEASENASGQIIREKNEYDEFSGGIVVPSSGNAYFDLSHEGNGVVGSGFKARTWYAVAVPWAVKVTANVVGGVYIKKKGQTKYERQTLGKTFDLIYYDGESRAKEGKNKSWRYVEDDPEIEQFMFPGVAYMIYLIEDVDVIRFQKTLTEGLDAVHKDYVEFRTYKSDIDGKYSYWYGVANPATYNAYLNVQALENKGQVYNADTKQYDPFDMQANQLIVGKPVFVQAQVDGITRFDVIRPTDPSSVRRRAKEQASLTRYELYLAPSQDVATDEVIIRMSEEKQENAYVVGQDLAKMGVSDLVPQMWIDRYDSKMLINTVAPEADNTADYPLGIFVPQNGEYDLFLDEESDSESNLYLTYDGEAIWNLSYGPYVASLSKGTDSHYGLRIVKKAPQITTGVEETTIQNGEAIRKVLVNDKVYIIRNGEKYSVTGQKAK